MKKLILPFLILVLASACATIKVSSDFDKAASFSGYKTYAFTTEALNLNIEELNRKRIITATENELAAKGFTKSDNPDVLVDLKITGEKKHGYRWGGGYGGGTTYVNYDSYVEGTMFIEMIDAAKKEIVWQGRGVGTIDPNASAKKREENINYAVKQIFTQYPPKAK